MLKRIKSLTYVTSIALIFGFFSLAKVAAETPAVLLGTATAGGGFPVYGAALVAAIKTVDPSIKIDAVNTRGSAENIPLLEAGKLDFALVQGESAHEALNGIGRAKANLRIFSAMYSAPGMFVVKADSPYKTIEDLVGQKIAFGASGSGLVILARYTLDGLGLDINKDFENVLLERAGDGPQLLLDGKVAALWGGGIGWPGFVTMANSPSGARFIVPSASQLALVRSKHHFLRPLSVPAGTYKGQDKVIQSVGSWSYILTRPDLDEGIVYRMAKALYAAQADLAQRLPQATETTAENTVRSLSRADLLHPGVVRFFKEIRLLKD